ncbi:uncharacterized protein EAF01_005737 [Botrytis porri]|uniref:uncharacterized protein n=1 Tax=Botrytis porri TaxID=87229 RepID=UPI001900D4A4|nr:uncharacterized protein EAF01_005737 [Botrytis porri]KAF7905216.1 hypothetical protein EAF01_005737 [Botrytis porri]
MGALYNILISPRETINDSSHKNGRQGITYLFYCCRCCIGLESSKSDLVVNPGTVKRTDRVNNVSAAYRVLDRGFALQGLTGIFDAENGRLQGGKHSQFPPSVRGDDSISVSEPKAVNVVTKPRIERIEVAGPRESTSDDSGDSDDFNYSNSVLPNVEELYWDFLGELSKFGARELSVSANFFINIHTESCEKVLPIDMHVLEFGPWGKMFKVIIKDTEGLSEYLKQTLIEIANVFVLLT